MNKVYIGLITQNEKSNIDELTSVAQHFDGLAAVDHKSNDGTFELLDARKGEGFVEQIPYYSHHAHSMNHFLFNPKIEIGDWVLLRDSSERINEDFAKQIKEFVLVLGAQGINSIYQYSKLLLFRRFPNQFFICTPHWGFQGARGNAVQVEKTNWFKSDEDYCYSVRNQKRDKFHFVGAYLRYYLILDSNHLMLGVELAEKLGLTYADMEKRRMEFLVWLSSKGYSLSVSGVDALLQDGLDEQGKEFFRKEKILNDYYRYHCLGKTDFTDNHDHKDLVEIP
jgi:hypothetical protein